jgi:hypothetical protein
MFAGDDFTQSGVCALCVGFFGAGQSGGRKRTAVQFIDIYFIFLVEEVFSHKKSVIEMARRDAFPKAGQMGPRAPSTRGRLRKRKIKHAKPVAVAVAA